MDFEEWLEENYPVLGLDLLEKEANRYIHKSTRNMHDAYLAGQQSKQAQINKALELLRQPMQGTVADLLSELEDILNDT